MSSMKETYGDKKGKSVFYATANKRKNSNKNKGKIDFGPSNKFKKSK